MDRLSDARQRLLDAIAPVLQGRASLYPPSQIVAPCLFIETSSGGLQASGNSTILVASFPVVIVVDGEQKPRVLALDELIASVYDAVRTVGTATGWQASTIDAGGPSLRAATLVVEMPLIARTLCDPTLT